MLQLNEGEQLIGCSNLMSNAVFLVASIGALIYGRCHKEKVDNCDFEVTYWATVLIGGLLGLSCIINLIDVWLWVKLFNPDLYLVHEAVRKFINSGQPP